MHGYSLYDCAEENQARATYTLLSKPRAETREGSRRGVANRAYVQKATGDFYCPARGSITLAFLAYSTLLAQEHENKSRFFIVLIIKFDVSVALTAHRIRD